MTCPRLRTGTICGGTECKGNDLYGVSKGKCSVKGEKEILSRVRSERESSKKRWLRREEVEEVGNMTIGLQG